MENHNFQWENHNCQWEYPLQMAIFNKIAMLNYQRVWISRVRKSARVGIILALLIRCGNGNSTSYFKPLKTCLKPFWRWFPVNWDFQWPWRPCLLISGQCKVCFPSEVSSEFRSVRLPSTLMLLGNGASLGSRAGLAGDPFFLNTDHINVWIPRVFRNIQSDGCDPSNIK